MNLLTLNRASISNRNPPWSGLLIGLVSWSFLGWAFVSIHAQPLCSNEWVKVRSADRADRVDFYVDNQHTAEISVHFKVTSVNLRGTETFPYTRVVPGNVKALKVFTLWPINPAARWSYRYDYKTALGNFMANHDTNHHYRLPFAKNAGFKVIQGFNGRLSHFGENQYAIDWNMPEGTPVHAARKGLVVEVKEDSIQGGPDKKFDLCANLIRIQHSDGTMGQYVHLKKDGAKVTVGRIVRAGDLIGYSGNTGHSHGPHLHFDVFKAKEGQARESFPILFDTDQGKGIVLQRRKIYRHPRP